LKIKITSKERRGGVGCLGGVGSGRQRWWLWVLAEYCGGARKGAVSLREREREEGT